MGGRARGSAIAAQDGGQALDTISSLALLGGVADSGGTCGARACSTTGNEASGGPVADTGPDLRLLDSCSKQERIDFGRLEGGADFAHIFSAEGLAGSVLLERTEDALRARVVFEGLSADGGSGDGDNGESLELHVAEKCVG